MTDKEKKTRKKIKKDAKQVKFEKVVLNMFEIHHKAALAGAKAIHDAIPKDVDAQSRWLLYGRALNRMFTGHYGVAYEVADKKTKEIIADKI